MTHFTNPTFSDHSVSGKGKLNPKVLQFRKDVASLRLEREVRLWMHRTLQERIPADVHFIARHIVQEAGKRIVLLNETPALALVHSALINTALYRNAGQETWQSLFESATRSLGQPLQSVSAPKGTQPAA